MKRYLLLFAVLCLTNTALIAGDAPTTVSVARFGARGDGTTDDSEAIQLALESEFDIVFENKSYLLKKPVTLNHLKYKKIDLRGATILKADNEQWTFRFNNCSNIRITGGFLTCVTMPTANSKSPDAHGFMFSGCENVSIRDIRISGSAQMGICVMGSIGMSFENNIIENCYRDGIYSHYSSNISYRNNRLAHIKDDALSIHDYGIPAQKKNLLAAGYLQSGTATISGNIVRNAYQGISSIGCDRLSVTDNIIDHTVNAGIAIFNSDRLFKGTDAKTMNVILSGNQIFNAGKDTLIMGKEYRNGLPDCTARAAITVQAQGHDHMYKTGTRRLADVIVESNIIGECGTEGISAHNVDQLTVLGNIMLNCNSSAGKATPNILEVIDCANIMVRDNTVIDNRAEPRHGRAWAIYNSTGFVGNFVARGFSIAESEVKNSQLTHAEK